MTAVPTPNIFNFEATTLYDEDKAAEALRNHPALYVNHLAIAQRLEQWGEELVGAEGFQAGFKDALLDVAAHLRQADYLPGSPELDL